MAKKRQKRNASNGAAPGNAVIDASADAARPPLSITTSTDTAHATLHDALERLDAIAQEAHVYTQQQQLKDAEANALTGGSAVSGQKRPREEGNFTQGHQQHTNNAVSPLTSSPAAAAALAAATTSTRLDVFAVTSALQYAKLTSSIAAFGLQLLPSLHDMSKRVTLAVLTPALSTAEAWETMAVLCSTYRAGMAHAVSDLLDSLLREPGVLLLDAPQLVPAWFTELFIHVLPTACAANTATAALGGLLAFAEDQQMRSDSANAVQQLARVHTIRVQRKLRALVDMLYATAAYVNTSMLQQFSLRLALEVVEGGMLPCYLSAAEAGEENVATFKVLAQAESSASPQQVLTWRVPPAWHAVSLELLEATLILARPAIPAQLLVSASRALDVVASRLHRGVPVLSSELQTDNNNSGQESAEKMLPLPVSHAVSTAVVRLGHTLHLLRHPMVLAPYQPPQLSMEKAKWRVFSVAPETAEAEMNIVNANVKHGMQPPVAVTEGLPSAAAATSSLSVPVQNVTAPVCTPEVVQTAAPVVSTSPAPPPAKTAVKVKEAPVVKSAPPLPAAPAQSPPQPSSLTAPPPLPSPSVDEDSDIPDIDLED